MKCVIISEKKVIDLGKRCLSNLRDFVNDEYFLGFNEVKRLRTLFFLACQKVFGEQQKSKLCNKLFNEECNEVWNEEFEKKFEEALMITEKSEIGDYKSKIEEVFNTPVLEKYSKKNFSLEETERIFDLIKKGLDKCFQLNEDLHFKIKNFKYIYYVYNYCYISLDSNYIFK